MQAFFPAIWVKNLKNGFYDNKDYNKPILFWNNQSISWYTEGRTSYLGWNAKEVEYIYCGIG